MLHPAALLTAEESRAVEKASGIATEKLMENAARAVVDLIVQQEPCPVLVVCGGGNNGGDGFIVASLLKAQGWPVHIAVTEASAVQEHAALFTPALLTGKKLVIDAIFGTGLNRDVEGLAKQAIDAINASKLPVVSMDIASGIHADSGAVMGAAIRAAQTVTFVRPKPGHVLLPGKIHSGDELHVADIGITGDGIIPSQFLNLPSLWKSAFPIPTLDSHKYKRGHALVIGGSASTTGATRLAAMAALRTGAGLVSVACGKEALPIYAASLTAVMTKPVNKLSELNILLEDKRITATLIGPGCGVIEATREQVLHILSHKKATVIDADAISIFENDGKKLFAAIAGPTVLTPHEGEFERLFNLKGSKTERAKEAAKQCNAVIVLKGSDTVIAAPDGRVSINANAPPWLATAGTGDILAGIITGLLAQGMPAYEAACAGVWMQGEAARLFGPGLIAEDLPGMLPVVLKELYRA